LRGLSKENYATHFRTLFKQFSVDSITEDKRDTLCRQVVDYSAAQRKRFIKAYLEVFNKSDPERALQLLKGCHKHFWAQVTCVKRNRAVVMAYMKRYLHPPLILTRTHQKIELIAQANFLRQHLQCFAWASWKE
jgi:hypothetical protein